jgi:ABC-2 type transport system ATP-binding protein
MAIIAKGKVLLEGAPSEALTALNGKIWSKVVGSDEELNALETQMQVVSTHLVAGQHEVRIYAESSPGDGFDPVDSELEDVYFLSLARTASN